MVSRNNVVHFILLAKPIWVLTQWTCIKLFEGTLSKDSSHAWRDKKRDLHKVCPNSLELGINHSFRRRGVSNWTKKPSCWPCFHFLDPCPFQTYKGVFKTETSLSTSCSKTSWQVSNATYNIRETLEIFLTMNVPQQ